MHRCAQGLGRREFLAKAGLLAAGALAGTSIAQADAPRIAVARSAKVLGDDGLDPDVVGRLIDEAVMWTTGEASADAAWGSLFSSDEVVGIKPNGLAGYECSTAPEVMLHCVDRLTGIGVRPGNIIVWEERPVQLAACGAPMDDPPRGIRTMITHDNLGEAVKSGGFEDTLFGPLHTEIDAILNLPIMKAHPICGVTFAMKNHYGSIGNPKEQHYDSCHRPIVDLANLPQIRDRTRLAICDGTRAIVEGQAYGQPQYHPNVIMAGTDLVAHDSIGHRIIAEERERRGIKPLADVGLHPKYIAMAEEAGLGISRWDAINTKVLDMD